MLKQKEIIKIQSWFRGHLTRKRIKLMIDNLFKRRKIIEELIQTEENYIRDLSIIVSDFKTVMVHKKLINSQQAHTIFSNVDEIRQLNELFFVAIFTEAQNYTHYKIIFEKVYTKIEFFKLYFEYFNNFTKSIQLIETLSLKNHEFYDFLKHIRTNIKYKLLSLGDYLIKPIQRLPKYVLIMKQVKKRTPLNHPDYKNIEKVLQKFEEVNLSNNEKLNKVVNSYKITQIQKNLLLPHNISEPGVEFISQEPVTVLSLDNKIYQCTMYLLNTEIIIAMRLQNKEKWLVSIPFKCGGNIMSNQDQYFYKNSFSVQNSDGDSCTFLCQTQQQKNLLMEKINLELQKAEQKNLEKLSALCVFKHKQSQQFIKKMSRKDMLPEVEILGTQQRSNSMFKYTVYIIEVRIKMIKQKIFVRFNELIELQYYLQNKSIELKNMLFKTTWLLNHDPKKIQQRKMNIQKFLKQILSKQEIIEGGADVLIKLGLPTDFYSLPQRFKQTDDNLKKSSISQRSTNSQDQCRLKKSLKSKLKKFKLIVEEQIEFIDKKKTKEDLRRISIQEILQANEINLGHYTRFSQVINRQSCPEIIQTSINVFLPWIQSETGVQNIDIMMNQNQRVLALIVLTAKRLDLKYYKDFRLFLERDYAVRQLDDDQYLPKVLNEMKNGSYRLIFKKMIYVDPQIEEKEIRSDRVRLKIIASQIIYQAKKDKYVLTYNNFLILAVLVGMTQAFKDKNINQVNSISLTQLSNGKLANKTRNMIANNYTSFYDGRQTWQFDYQRTFKLLLKKLCDISQENIVIYRKSNIQSPEQEFNTTSIAQLAAISIIMEIKNNIFYGSNSFIVQMSEEFRKLIQETCKQDHQNLDSRNCWLVVKHNQIHLFSISLTKCIYSLTYQDIFKIQPYPSSIILHLRGKSVDFLKLKTTSSYSIRQLLVYYTKYNELVSKMKEDASFQDSIIELVKEQNRQSTLSH